MRTGCRGAVRDRAVPAGGRRPRRAARLQVHCGRSARGCGSAGWPTRSATLDKPVLGICGGYQMLGRRIVDDVESGRGEVAGLGLLDLDVEFAADKTLARPVGTRVRPAGVRVRDPPRPGDAARGPGLVELPDGSDEGRASPDRVAGTHWHGLSRQRRLPPRRSCGGPPTVPAAPGSRPAPDVCVADARAAQLDLLGRTCRRPPGHRRAGETHRTGADPRATGPADVSGHGQIASITTFGTPTFVCRRSGTCHSPENSSTQPVPPNGLRRYSPPSVAIQSRCARRGKRSSGS